MGFLYTLALGPTNISAGLTIQSLPPPHFVPCTLGLLSFVKEPFLPSQKLAMRVIHGDTGTARITEITQTAQDISSRTGEAGLPWWILPGGFAYRQGDGSSFTKFYPVRLLLYLLGDLASFALGEGTSK